MTDAEALVVTTVDSGVAEVQLNREHARNALSAAMMEQVAAALEAADRRPDVRTIVIAGHDRAFVAGTDLTEMIERDLDTILTQSINRFWARIDSVTAPLIAAVSGYALGAGFELALACDLIVAAESAVFGQPEVTVGIVPGGGASQRLTHALGKQRAMELILTGRRLGAAEAHAWGLVNRVVPNDRWRPEARALGDQLAGLAPHATRLAKRAVRTAEETTLSAGIAAERRLYELSMATGEYRERMSHFADRTTRRENR